MAYRKHKDPQRAVRSTTPPVDTIYPSPPPSPCSPRKTDLSVTEEAEITTPEAPPSRRGSEIRARTPGSPPQSGRDTGSEVDEPPQWSTPASVKASRKVGPPVTEEVETTTPEAPPGRRGSEVRARTPGSPPRSERDTGSEVDEAPQWPTPASVEAFLLFFRQQRQQGRCGGLTVKNKPCQRFQRQAKQSEIDAAISLLRRLPRSMPCHTLADTLRKLVLLTHCDKHDGEKTVSARVNTWLNEYFPRPNDAAMLIQKALPDLSTTCLGSKDCSCEQSLGGRAVQTIEQILSKIKDPVVYLNDKRLTIWLTRLGQHVFCALHRETLSPLLLERCLAEIAVARHCRVQKTRIDHVPEDQDEAEEFWQAPGYDTSPFHLLATGRPSIDDGWMPAKAHLKSPGSRNTRPGYIYAYTVAGNERYVKIGYTCNTISQRHEEWTFSCNREVISLYPAASAVARRVESPQLVESLCHAELRAHRIRIYCGACQKQHVEWFDVTSDRATIVIEKWSQWMARVADQRPNWSIAVKAIVRGNADLEAALHELTQL
ncbi:DUF1766-domain-containing protein [Aspergillus uvarum CBS 121591]|uniref:DUF1766-domain-containing protein n=1 Tax=Aspergillus uvarum CBS 121591 TaxID=1448315 RepID=A0A319CHE3_9EURO|nr:DUF1766-domain-containing protein [Aspergillus uvarum CBS 121591]PYH83271.1 DUF1766-domain-containing protein [Aspergillus uvarum CBS 121591]